MTLFTNAQVKLIAANDAGDIKVYTDFIQAGLYATLFPAMKNAIEATVEAFAEPEQSQDVVAHVWHTFSKEFTNGGSDYGPKTRAGRIPYKRPHRRCSLRSQEDQRVSGCQQGQGTRKNWLGLSS